MRAVVVSVDFSDLLALTLPVNRRHFEQVYVITTPADRATQDVADRNGAVVWETNAFYRNGAVFNKWLALEECLDAIGREGWLCHLDADTLWPQHVPAFPREVGFLYTPLRRIYDPIRLPLPPESEWSDYPVHQNIHEWAGYSQIYHASDPHLGLPPWHETNWKHAGGADSVFQWKWPPAHKVRPPFEVLHLGPAGENWMGRVTPFLNGSVPAEADGRRRQLADVWRGRRGKPYPARHAHERL
jgi:hypothetical protein